MPITFYEKGMPGHPSIRRIPKYLFLILFILPWHFSTAQFVVRVAGNDSFGYQGDGGAAINASMYVLYGVNYDASGNLYFADNLWGIDCCGWGSIRKVDAASGIISTIAGGPYASSYSSNIPATNAAVFPFGLKVDASGNIYIAEGGPNVRMINHATGIISIVAGINDTGYSGDGGPATLARLYDAQDIALDTAGNFYIADGVYNVIRKVNLATGIITTVAGNGNAGFSGDGGPATAALLNGPQGVFVDKHNNIYIADLYNSRLRMVEGATGRINTIMGNGVDSVYGDGGPATSAATAQPSQIIVDDSGNVFFTDNTAFFESSGSATEIRRIDAATHVVTRFAGTGSLIYRTTPLGDGGPVTAAAMAPSRMCFDKCGDLVFTDGIGEVRAIVPTIPANGSVCGLFVTNSVPVGPAAGRGMEVYPNPAGGTFTVSVHYAVTEPLQIIVTNLLGQQVKAMATMTNLPTKVILDCPAGTYIIEAIVSDNKWQQRLSIR